MILEKMGNHSNWSAVAYAASIHKTEEDTRQASWIRDDLQLDIQDYLGQLTEPQRKIVATAFGRGMAEWPGERNIPESVTLDWIEKNTKPR